MEFRSKVDNFFVATISFILLIILATFIIPLSLDNEITITKIIIVLSLCGLTIGLVLWFTFFIKYVFYQDHLFIKCGPLRSRIPYEEISNISTTTDIYTGYRLLSSKNAIEIFYKSAAFGSVKISPTNIDLFISEIKKRCPNVKIDI